MATTDEQLITRIKDGDNDALNELMQEYYLPVFKIVRRSISCMEDAEDVTQNVFLHLIKAIHSFRGDSSFYSWFMQLVHNKIVDYWRVSFRYKQRSVIMEKIQRMTPFYEMNDDTNSMSEILADVPDKYRWVLLMRLGQDMSFVEIAKKLEKDYEAVHSIYRRAVAYAAEKLNQEDLRP